MNVQVIIPAAGSGKRFGALKQFLSLQGKPVLIHTLSAFEQSSLIKGICVVTLETEVSSTQKMIQEAGFKKVHHVIAGGQERQDSVKKGFRSLPPCDMVMVHDGVRPFVTQEMIKTLVSTTKESGATIVGLPIKETLKKVREGCIIDTVDRSEIWSIQTPQAFRYDLLARAIQKAEIDHFLGTDEAMLVERMGVTVKIVLGSPYNIKITLPEDLRIAETLAQRQENI